MCLSDGETDGIRKSLTERTSGNFDAFRIMRFWMTRRDAVESLNDIATLAMTCAPGDRELTHTESLEIV